MSATAKSKPTAPTFHTHNGTTYRVRGTTTYRFTVWNVGGKWVEVDGRNSHRTTANYRRLQLPCLNVVTVATTLSRNGQRVYLTRTDVTGEYADCLDYFGELVNTSGVVSNRDRSGLSATSLV